LFALRTAAGQDFRRGGEKINKIHREPAGLAWPNRPVMLFAAIVVPRGAATINARMASGVSIRLEALTNYGDPVTSQSKVTGRGSPRQTGSGPVRISVGQS
jgi:hypothetical protein